MKWLRQVIKVDNLVLLPVRGAWINLKKAGKAYGRHNTQSANEENRRKERLWLSPHCLNGEPVQLSLE